MTDNYVAFVWRVGLLVLGALTLRMIGPLVVALVSLVAAWTSAAYDPIGLAR